MSLPMMETKESPSWPPSIANWLAFENNQPWIATEEFPLFTDARITGQAETGPYLFINTVASGLKYPRSAIVLRYDMRKTFDYPNFQKTDAELYHGGSPQQELAALASLAMGIRLKAGRAVRRFEPNGDRLGTPTELGGRIAPYFQLSDSVNLPSVAQGHHALDALHVLNCLPKLSPAKARAIVRAARLYQDALWLAESEPELTWLLLVSALETAANEWQKGKGDKVAALRDSIPELCEFLESQINGSSVLRKVAGFLAHIVGSTRKFLNFVMEFLPEPPCQRPPEWAQFEWVQSQFKNALKIIYGLRSKALHEGRPFPSPMCKPPFQDSSWQAPAEKSIAQGTSERGGVWLKKDIPMNLHLFEYIARNVLLNWWQDRAGSFGICEKKK